MGAAGRMAIEAITGDSIRQINIERAVVYRYE
jgi:hypothetical protein